MKGHDIITIGASAGGVEALGELAGGLPADLPASVFVALHVPSHGGSVLPQILSRRGPLPAAHAEDGEAIEPGRIYVAPPDQHLLIHEGIVRLSRGPRENGFRPAIDPLFRTAARWYGPRAVGVILSGTLDDGTAGLLAIKERGGVAVVQDPDDALFPGCPAPRWMSSRSTTSCPLRASPNSSTDWPARARSGKAVTRCPTTWKSSRRWPSSTWTPSRATTGRGLPRGSPAPTARGSSGRSRTARWSAIRCRVGHAWSPTSLLAEQSKALEVALWTAFRALEERAALADRMAERFRSKGPRARPLAVRGPGPAGQGAVGVDPPGARRGGPRPPRCPRPRRRKAGPDDRARRARPPFEVVALAASAGGLNALSEVLAALPADFRAAIVLVQHLDPKHRSMMAEILGRRTSLRGPPGRRRRPDRPRRRLGRPAGPPPAGQRRRHALA